jgi:hypothetical protein
MYTTPNSNGPTIWFLCTVISLPQRPSRNVCENAPESLEYTHRAEQPSRLRWRPAAACVKFQREIVYHGRVTCRKGAERSGHDEHAHIFRDGYERK